MLVMVPICGNDADCDDVDNNTGDDDDDNANEENADDDDNDDVNDINDSEAYNDSDADDADYNDDDNNDSDDDPLTTIMLMTTLMVMMTITMLTITLQGCDDLKHSRPLSLWEGMLVKGLLLDIFTLEVNDGFESNGFWTIFTSQWFGGLEMIDFLRLSLMGMKKCWMELLPLASPTNWTKLRICLKRTSLGLDIKYHNVTMGNCMQKTTTFIYLTRPPSSMLAAW